MQTFLPYATFTRTARVLDTRRLGKQRVEVLQILRALHVEAHGWRHHPVVAMWRGQVEALVAYGGAICSEWTRRGFPDTCLVQIGAFVRGMPTQKELRSRGRLPWWLGWRPLHRSHQSALVRKAPGYYRRFFPNVPADLPYVWPKATRAPARVW